MIAVTLPLALAGALAAAVAAAPEDGAGSGADHDLDRDDDTLLAIDPHITIGDCGSGTAIDLVPNMQPRTVTGSIDGAVSGEALFGTYCVGYYSEPAQVCVNVAGAAGYYTFEITEAQSIDTTLAISGPGFEYPYCDDDGAGHDLLSKAVVWLEPGSYRVWAGSYSQGGVARFTLSVQGGEHW